MMLSTQPLAAYYAERNQRLDQITQLITHDPHVVAAWLFGSLGRGKADELSDIDLWLVMAAEDLPLLPEQRRAYVTQIGEPLLVLEAPQNAPEGGAYLTTVYASPTGPHIVDWYWQPQTLAFIPPQTKVLFDRANLRHLDRPIKFAGGEAGGTRNEQLANLVAYFWVMLLVNAKRVRRLPHLNETELLTAMVQPLEQINLLLNVPSAYPTIPLLPTSASKLRFLRQIAREVSLLMQRLADEGVPVPTQMPEAMNRYLDLLMASLTPRDK